MSVIPFSFTLISESYSGVPSSGSVRYVTPSIGSNPVRASPAVRPVATAIPPSVRALSAAAVGQAAPAVGTALSAMSVPTLKRKREDDDDYDSLT